MIEIQNLTKHYGQIKAVNNLNFTVEKGEILGFLGPNGAGKSTTMNMITGYIPSTEGTVKVAGYDIAQDAKEVKKRIGYLPEIPPLYTDMTVKEYLGFVSELKQVEKKKRKSQMSDIMELLRITDVSGRLIKNLSKGYKQRVGFAQALIGSPDVLILDEPTVGLDPTQIIEVRKLIKALSKEHTIIFSSHILQEVSSVCERVIIINKGNIVAIDSPENLSKQMGNTNRFSVTIAGPDKSVLEVLKSIDGVVHVETQKAKHGDDFEYFIDADKNVDIRKPMFFGLAKAGYPILELKSLGASLEDIFLELTKGKNLKQELFETTAQDNEQVASEEDISENEREVE